MELLYIPHASLYWKFSAACFIYLEKFNDKKINVKRFINQSLNKSIKLKYSYWIPIDVEKGKKRAHRGDRTLDHLIKSQALYHWAR